MAMSDFPDDPGPMGPQQDCEPEGLPSRSPEEFIDLLRCLVDEWFDRNQKMPKSFKHEAFWMRVYAMMVGREDQVAVCLDPLLDEPLPPILAVMVRARLRRFAEEQGNKERAAELAMEEHAIAQEADDEHFKVLALSALVPYLSRVMDLRGLSKETTRIGLLGQQLFNRTLDGCLEAAGNGDPIGGAMRRAIFVCSTIEGFQNLHLWLMVERLLEMDIYELAPDFVQRRELHVVKRFAGDVKMPDDFGSASFFRMLAAWELAVYEQDKELPPTTEKTPAQWREAAMQRANKGGGGFQPDQVDLQFYATFSLSLASKASALEILGSGAIDAFQVMRLALVYRVAAKLAATPDERQLEERHAVRLENSIGMTWPHYAEHVALSDLW
jgi:hypothetical protein